MSPWDAGLEVDLWKVSPLELRPGTSLVITKGDYYGAEARLAGEIVKYEMSHEGNTMIIKPTGTDHEGILRACTARPQETFSCHVCPQGCARQVTGDYIIHGLTGRKKKDTDEEGWVSNLGPGEAAVDVEDENAALRARASALQQREGNQQGAAPGGMNPLPDPGRVREEGSSSKKKKKKKKAKEAQKAKDMADGRYPALAVQKDLAVIFGGTGLDPREKVRRRVQAKAQRVVSRKKAKKQSDSSSSSSSSTTPSLVEPQGIEAVFAEETKIRAVAERFPGALCMETVANMKRFLLVTSGEELEDNGLRAVAMLYYRNILSKVSSGAQGRELLNLSAALDQLLKGRIAGAADILAQRLKAQQSVCQGTHWNIAVRLEIPPSDQNILVQRSELQEAQREDYQDSRARWRTQSSAGGKSEQKGKSKGSKGDREQWRREDRKEEDKNKKGKGQERK